MVEINATQMIRQLEQGAQLKAGTLMKKGFRPFANQVLEDVPEEDQRIIFSIMLSYLGKSVAIAQERRRRYLSRQRFVSSRARAHIPQPTKSDVERAMLFARQDLLKANSGISDRTREFIKDHCPCA